MKKNIMLTAMLLILSLQTFADEDSRELEIINSLQSIFDYKTENPELNLSRRNPLFFSHYGLFLNTYRRNVYENIPQPNNTHNEQNISQNSQENNWLGFLLIMGGYSILWTDAYKNPLRYRYLEDAWERHKTEEKMYRHITGNHD